eukprot:5447914-Alexandrium_andersonii.AAC.1
MSLAGEAGRRATSKWSKTCEAAHALNFDGSSVLVLSCRAGELRSFGLSSRSVLVLSCRAGELRSFGLSSRSSLYHQLQIATTCFGTTLEHDACMHICARCMQMYSAHRAGTYSIHRQT